MCGIRRVVGYAEEPCLWTMSNSITHRGIASNRDPRSTKVASSAAATNTLDILLVGPYPPPLGGVSAHVSRLAQAIQDTDLTVGVLNHFRTRAPNPLIVGDLRRNPVRYWVYLRRSNARVVHYHHARWSTLIATALALSRPDRPATAITVHGQVLDAYLARPWPVGRLTRRALRSFDRVIAVSDEIAHVLRRALPGRPVDVIPAYLPARSDDGTTRLSTNSHAFLAGGHPTLIVAAYRLLARGSATDVYGLGLALGVFISLATDHPGLQLELFVAQPARSRRERRYQRQLLDHAAAAGVADRLRIGFGESLVPALSYDCVFLRPSTTDGDAVAVREALAAGRPVLASDVVARPAGVEVLPLEPEAWRTAILKTTCDPARGQTQGRAPDRPDALEKVYRALLAS